MNISYEQIQVAVIVFLALCGVIVAVDKCAATIRGWFRPSNEHRSSVGQMLANDKARLDQHERAITDLRKGQKVICLGVQELLEHELHNGNAAEMKKAADDINRYLVERE